MGELSSKIPQNSLTYDLISTIIAGMDIPFPLEKIRCDLKPSAEPVLENIHDLITHVLDECRSTFTRFSESDRKLYTLYVIIENRVILPRHEIDAMNREKDKQERELRLLRKFSDSIHSHPPRYPSFKWLHGEIEGVANVYEQDDLELSLLELAMKDYFQGLETLKFEGEGDEQSLCAICNVEILIGSRVTSMPCSCSCSHIYHVSCIAEHLKKSHICPSCRFELSKQLYDGTCDDE